ncbi:poly [ADP-ribose] polymerase 1-like isoform X1 [Musa acuminata AAA Group]|uniref:poly [ADP-ribose] polymerase 1-like isoform X1 n=1 Tax=Musa acuminata AAA Group TaxID=214697 RepID=UPI0031E1FA40
MANPPKPWKAEYAKSGRSSCKTCKSPIDRDQLRLGKTVAATQFDGYMPMWNHAGCIFKKQNQIKSLDDVEGVDLLRWEDQKGIRKYVEDGSSTSTTVANSECAIEVSQTSRATCRHCSQKITKGTVRVSTKAEGQSARGISWHHVNCFNTMSPSTSLEKISGWDSLSPQDKESLSAFSRKDTSKKTEDQVTSRSAKRKAVGSDEQKAKVSKSEKRNSAGKTSTNGSKDEPNHGDFSTIGLEKKLEEQSKLLWDIKDQLKIHVTTAELREMLEANGQDSTGSEYDLRDRCADGMLFGALGTCPICSGSLCYSGGQYRCHGYLSAWSKCSYTTTEPVRLKAKWKIPKETSNGYLIKWFKSQKANKPGRVLPPPSTSKSSGRHATNLSQPSNDEKLENLKVAIAGGSAEDFADLKTKLEAAGVKFHMKIAKDTSCLIWVGEVVNDDSEMRKARRMKLPIVRVDYLQECMRKQKKLPFDLYKIENFAETSRSGTITVRVKGRSAVHEASGMQDTGHILEDGKSIYNTTLNMSDLSTGINSYYILQIIQEDKGSGCYVFRKWGRVGNNKIGGTKLDGMSKSDAIQEFKRLFLEKTGNPWEAWEQKRNFEKQPGRFYPLDIDYGIKQVPKKKDLTNKKSQLAPQLMDLMKMLFNVETYRAAMLEFEINMSEMPLGKLTKKNIQKGFEALTEIQNLVCNSDYDPAIKESLIIDASNRFFTLIPSIHPHVIRHEDDVKAKVKMLEALQDIEIASRLVCFDGDDDESLDDKYKKLRCDITPLLHDSEDYQLVEKYLLNTHAPTHKDWTLELEEVFALEREGEFDKFAPRRDTLQNKMLLWHGSRLTNFVGILSQGLRIAPPEAPATGYMFGKGIYFADLVSKSAQYCYVDKKDPVGLMLLSEVALGEIYELKKATYMDKPPKGKLSTKGLGKTVPLESEHVKWKDEVVVPCGRPVPSSVRASELLYNEYIVYDTAQVKMQFLLKVRFHHKR